MKEKFYLRRLILPFFLIIFLIIIIPWIFLWRTELNHFKKDSIDSIELTKKEIENTIREQKNSLLLGVKSIANNEKVKEDLKNLDIENLFSNWNEVFKEMKDEAEITHFYFFDPNRICVLRIHNPQKRGDFIDRFTAREAEITKKTSHGLEVGPLGTLTLRMVEPIFLDGNLIGYVELGKEIEDVLDLVIDSTKNDIAITIYKKHLNQNLWEEGMLILERESDWNFLEDKVLIYSSVDIPRNIWPYLKGSQEISFNDQEWINYTYSLIDASDQEIGEIIILKNISLRKYALFRILIIGGISAFLFLLVLTLIIYIFLQKVDKFILNQEKELKENINRLNELSIQSRTFLWEVDKNANYTYVSDNVKEIIGYSKEELLKKSVIDLHPEEGREDFKNSVFGLISNKDKMTGFENPIVSKNGQTVWVLSAGIPVLDNYGNLIRYRGSDTDITNLKKIERDLKRKKEDYEFLISNIPGIVYRCLFDEKWTMIYLGKNIEELSGYEITDFIHNKVRTYESIIYKEDRKYVEEKIKKAIQDNNSWDLEYRIIDKDENIKWVLERGRGIIKNNEVKFLDGIIFNITEKKEVERKLAISNQNLEKFKLAVENASDHIVITDEDGVCLFANDVVEKITGFSKKEIIGKKVGTKENWGGLMDQKTYEEMWKNIKEEKKPFFGELKNKRKNGQEYYAKASIAPILNENKEVIFFVGIERDITNEKEIDKAKTEFVSLASHQLRTPLSVINWYSEMVLSGDAGKINKEQKKYVEEIYAANQRMIALVESLLNVSRLELGTFTIKPEIADLKKTTQDAIKNLKIKIKEKKQTIKEKYENNLPKINADLKLLNIIIENLISNAIKYTPEKGIIKVDINTVKRGSSVNNKKVKENSVLIKISDNGYGISLNQQDKVFQKFFRADNILSKDTEGTGLGLYIIKSIVDHSGGSISFKSIEDKGTTFYVTLPLSGMKKRKEIKVLD